MSIKQPIYHEFDLNATSGNSRVISLTHTDDAHVDVIELCVKQQGAKVDITGATVVARMVLHGTTDVLLNDSVPCTINDAGNILIPFDNAAVQTRKGIVKIEVNITRTPDILTLQLPLWVKINGSILDSATVDPHSEGTIPELLKDAADALEEATQALEDAKDYTDLENKPQINSHTLSGNQSSDELGLQKKLTAGTNITLESDGTISASGGVTSYNDLTDKPKIKINTRDSQGNELGLIDVPIDGIFGMIYGFKLYYESTGNKYITLQDVRTDSLDDNKDFLVGRRVYYGKYNFNSISSAFLMAGIWEWAANKCINTPSLVNEYFVQGSSYYNFFIVHIYANSHVGGSAPITRLIIGRDIQSKLRILCQQIIAESDGTVTNSTDWVELTGSSQIVSGVVNQNGTITFTDSDGNTFTTTGSSVIGFSPTATVTQTASGATVSITDSTGTTTANISNGADGQDYVLTAQDKSDIADIVLSELPTTQGVLYGNTSN